MKSIKFLFVFGLILALLLSSGCLNKKIDQSSQNGAQNVVSQPIDPIIDPMKSREADWLSFTENHVGISSSTFQMPMQEEPFLLGNENLLSLFMYDPLNGSTLGVPSFLGYSNGILSLGKSFVGGTSYIRYSVGSQIPYSGTIQFYFYCTRLQCLPSVISF